MTIILAIDPGTTTGFALFNEDGGHFISYEVEGPVNAVESVTLFLDTAHTANDIVEIVCESFVISARTIKTQRVNDPWEIKGWIKLECLRRDVAYTEQSPATGKSFGTDDKLRKIGWFRSSEGGHANDAARHLITYLAQHHLHIARELLS